MNWIIDAGKMRDDWLHRQNENIYCPNDVLDSIDEQPIVDVIPRTKEAAIDFLREIGFMHENDKEYRTLQSMLDAKLQYCNGNTGKRREGFKEAILSVKSMLHDMYNNKEKEQNG